MELIPGLPDDVALDCLVHVPFNLFSTATAVSTSWKTSIELPEFRQRRTLKGLTQSIIVMAQARVHPTTQDSYGMKFVAMPVYRLVLCEPETGQWCELPPMPGFTNGLPMFCKLVGVGLDLVVMGGYNPVSWEISKSVFIYNFVLAKWRRGVDMPGGARSFFGCTSDTNQMVFIAGGHDDNKNALRSAMVYDVAKNNWAPLPDMSRERDECKVIFHGGKFHVIGGYDTKRKGRFGKSAEAFDIATWQWDHVEEDFLGIATCPRSCTYGGDGRLYMCREGKLVILENASWQVMIGLPDDVCNVTYLTTWRGQFLIIGHGKFGDPYKAYLADLKNQMWTKLEYPKKYSGHVQSGCCMEI